MALQPPFIPLLVSAATLAGMGIVVFAARPSGRLNRSFAFLLVVQALFFGLLALEQDPAAPLGRLRVYVIIAAPFATLIVALQILVCYRAGAGKRLPHGWVLAGLIAAGLLCEVAYFRDHSLFATQDPVTGFFSAGPFDLFFEIGFLSTALAGLLFAFALRNNRLGLTRQSLWQAMAAFSVVPIYYPAFFVSTNLSILWGPAPDPVSELFPMPQMIFMAATVATVLASLLVSLTQPDGKGRRDGARFAFLLALVVASGITAGLLMDQQPFPNAYVVHFVMYGLWSLASAVLLAAPILRDHILDVDLHVERTFRNGFLVTLVGGAAFVGMQLATNFLSQGNSFSIGPVSVGGGVAVLMLFGLHPLQRFCDRLTRMAMPSGPPIKGMSPADRQQLYAEQAGLAWSDGNLSRKERRLLDQLRERLQLDHAMAARLESKAASGT